MSSVCFRCGERNPASVHTCSPQQHERSWVQLELPLEPPRPWHGLPEERKISLATNFPWNPQQHHVLTLIDTVEAELREKNA